MEKHLHVSGIHCKSCVILLEEIISEHLGRPVQVNEARRTITLEHEGDDGALIAELNALTQPHGYTVSAHKESIRWREIGYGFIFALIFIVIFLGLQKLGLVRLISSSEVNWSTALIVGVVASLSSCLAIVGGLVLSISAVHAQRGGGRRAQILFHAGRLFGFAILGALVGAVGATLRISVTGYMILGIITALIMILLGANLLDLTRFSFTLPTSFNKKVGALATLEHGVIPLVLGAATFFLPCGFTQSMQLYALTSGSWIIGAQVMFFFALGTLPVLALLSFGSQQFEKMKWRGVAYKAAGFVVIFLGILTLTGALATAGIMKPLINF